jgi:hypothetical protein
MLKYVTAIVCCCILLACGKKDSESDKIVKGDVLIGIKAGTPIDSVFSLCSRLDLKIKMVRSFVYGIPSYRQPDSISAYFNSKPYVDAVNWKAKVAYNSRWGQTVYSNNFFDMDSSDQADWLLTVKTLNLTDLGADFGTAHLRVPYGTEQYWVDLLSKNHIISWAELNHIVNIELGK